MNDTATPERTALAEAASTAVAPAEKPTLKSLVLASYSVVETQITALAGRHRDVAHDCTTPKGLAAAKAARHELREDGRYAAQRLQTALKGEANDLKKVIDAETDRLVGIIKPVEDAIDGQIAAEETRKAAEKAAREAAEASAIAAEAARVAEHRRNITAIDAYLPYTRANSLSSERIQIGIDRLRAMTFGPEWQEFAQEATLARDAQLAGMEDLYRQTKAREEEAARVEEQRLENERQAAELAEQRRQLAEQAAELERQRAAAEKDSLKLAPTGRGNAVTPGAGNAEAAPNNESAAVDPSSAYPASPADLDAQGDGPGAFAAQTAARALIEQAEPNTPVQGTQQVLKAEPATADATACVDPATASPRVGAMGAGQAADAAPAGAVFELLALVAEARAGRFPTHPKPGPEWWARLYAVAEHFAALAD